MSYLSRRLNSSKNKGKSVYDSIRIKNTNPTTETILSFTEREFARCFADIKFLVENTRFENDKMPFCGQQFLEDIDNQTQNKHKFLLMKDNPNGSTLNQLNTTDLRHLEGKPLRDGDSIEPILDVRDKKDVEQTFNKFADNYYPEKSGYNDNRCDIPTCEVCPTEEKMI